jgi:hypothetical protein
MSSEIGNLPDHEIHISERGILMLEFPGATTADMLRDAAAWLDRYEHDGMVCGFGINAVGDSLMVFFKPFDDAASRCEAVGRGEE